MSLMPYVDVEKIYFRVSLHHCSRSPHSDLAELFLFPGNLPDSVGSGE